MSHITKFIGFIMILALVVFAACGKKTVVGQSRHNKAAIREINEGNAWYMRGCYHKALEHFHKAYERYTISDDQDGVARSLNNLGSLYRATKDHDSALAFFDGAERIFTRINQTRGLVQTLSNKAALFTDMGNLAAAESALDQADSRAQKENIILPTLSSNRALIRIRQKKYDEARALLNLAMAQSSESRPFEYATINHAMGLFMETAGDPDQALEFYTKALEADRKANFSRSIAADLAAIGNVHIARGRHELALDYLYRSFQIQTLMDDVDGAEKTTVLLKRCIEALGDKKQDTRVTEHFLKRWSESKRPVGACE